MKKWIPGLLLMLFVAVVNQNCYENGGPVGPYHERPPIDTTKIVYLDTARVVQIHYCVQETIQISNSPYLKYIGVSGADVSINNLPAGQTDSLGILKYQIIVDALPIRICFSSSKNGYVDQNDCYWKDKIDLYASSNWYINQLISRSK